MAESCAPPPPPLPSAVLAPPPPPLPPLFGSGSSQSRGDGRSALLDDIRKGASLKKTPAAESVDKVGYSDETFYNLAETQLSSSHTHRFNIEYQF